MLAAGAVQAQVTLDGTTGPAGPLSGPAYEIGAALGTRAGQNLFHSFETFNLRARGGIRESATFTGPPATRHVISRVTGGQRSTINGTIRTMEMPRADFWFINPAGVLFGPNASLEVEGSFHVSSADEVRFADGSRFSARDPASSSFTVAAPEAFGFLGADPGALTVDGSILEVPPGETFEIAGGDVTLASGGQASATTRGSENAGEVRVESKGTLSLKDPFSGLFANSLARNPDSGNAGLVEVHAENLNMRGFALMQAVTQGGGQAGEVVVDAGTLSLLDGSRIEVGPFAGTGHGGRAQITVAGQLLISGDPSGIFGTAFFDAQGDAGSIWIKAHEVTLLGNTRIQANSQRGRSGDITLQAGRLRLVDGGQIANSVGSLDPDVQGGVLRVEAAKEIEVRGFDPDSGFRSGLFSDALGNADGGRIEIRAPLLLVNGGRITSDASPEARSGMTLRGKAGDVIVDVGDLLISNQGQIFAGTDTAGDGGIVRVSANRIVLEGTKNIGDFTGIFSNVKENGAGDGGRIAIAAGDLLLLDGGRISTRTLGSGAAGEIEIALTGLLLVGGESTVETQVAAPRDPILAADAGTVAGDLTVDAGGIELRSGSTVSSASARGPGRAGRVTLRARQVVTDRSTIATEGQIAEGGQIVLDAASSVVLSESEVNSDGNVADRETSVIVVEAPLVAINGSRVRAVTAEDEPLAGVVTVDADATVISVDSVVEASSSVSISGLVQDFGQQLVVLPTSFIDAASLLRERCAARGTEEISSFTAAGRDALPPDPDQPLPSYPVSGPSPDAFGCAGPQ